MATAASKQVTPIPKGSTAKRAGRSTRAEEAARSAVSKVVRPGEASSKRKAADNKARAQANADKVAALNAREADAAKSAAETIAKVTVRPSDVRTAAASRVERVKLAKEEQKALREWQATLPESERGPKPASPNLDALNAGEPVPEARVKGPGRASNRGPRGLEALAEKKRTGDKRGPGKRISDEELLAYVRKVRAEHPTSSSDDEREYAYHIAKLALSGKERWQKAWQEAGKPAPASDPKATTAKAS